MAIADGGDTAFDSAVFLQAGSFESNAVFITNSTAIGGNPIFGGDSLVVEGCNDATFSFIRPNANQADTLYFDILGTAENGVDYTSIADSIVMEEGETLVNITFNAIDDGITEGLENIILQYIYENSCGEIDTAQSELWVVDYVDPGLVLDDTSLPCPGEPFTIIPETSGFGPFTYLWDDDSNQPSLTVTPDETTTYSLEITDICGTTISEDITVSVVDWPDLVITPNDAFSGCPGEPVEISVTAEGGSPGYTYSWLIGGSDENNTVNPLITTDYTVTVSDQCESQQVVVTAEVVILVQDITTLHDDSLCLGSAGQFVNLTGGTGNYTYIVTNTGDGTTSDAIDFSETGLAYSGSELGVYDIEIVDQCDWVNPYTVTVTIVNCDTFFPNVFTPDTDGNGLNETFQVIGLEGFPNSRIVIYNRWGGVIYEDDNYNNNQAWNGKDLSGNDVGEGVYFYTFFRSDGKEQSGSITLLRK